MYCAKCGQEITDSSQKFCFKCGTPVGEAGTPDNTQIKAKPVSKVKGMDALTSRINSLAGGQGAVALHLKDLYTDVFKHHGQEESESLFICGTSTTTPKEEDILAEWPKPWLYSRVGLVLIIAFAILVFIYKHFSNPNVLPDILFIGSLAIPMTVLVLFFEMNVPRNISFINLIKMFLLGGAASLVTTLFLFDNIDGSGTGDILPSMLTGLIEETGKVLIAAYLISKMKGKKWLLNGIVAGGAVGAGFAVFESAGYALRNGIYGGINTYEYCMTNGYADIAVSEFFRGFYSRMMTNTVMRGFLSPGGHVAWTAVAGFALVYALEGRDFSWDVLIHGKFLKIFWIPVVLHGLWDSFIPSKLPAILNVPLGYIVLMIAIWIVLLVFIDRGLKEINEFVQSKAIEAQPIEGE